MKYVTASNLELFCCTNLPPFPLPDEPGHPVHTKVVEHPVVGPWHHLVGTGWPATSVETKWNKCKEAHKPDLPVERLGCMSV